MSGHRIVKPPELGEPSGFWHAVMSSGSTVHLAGQIGEGATQAMGLFGISEASCSSRARRSS
jgi:hypothetical protein